MTWVGRIPLFAFINFINFQDLTRSFSIYSWVLFSVQLHSGLLSLAPSLPLSTPDIIVSYLLQRPNTSKTRF